MKITVLSFNIRCCDDPDGYSIAERAPRLNAVTDRLGADVIGFQEIRRAWEPHINDHYLSQYDMFLKYRNETDDVEAAAILWRKDRFELVDSGYFWLSDTPNVESRGWDEVYNCYRICIYVTLKDKESGVTFTAANTHFGFGDSGQMKSARLIAERCKEASCGRVFVVGDFNMTPQSLGYREMTSYFTDSNAVTANDLTTTYHGYDPQKKTDGHIDYCFIGDGVAALSQKIIKDTVDGKYPSDHFGVLTALEL